jgi:hypothetical protein
MMMKTDVYTRAIASLKKTQDALLNEISIADGRSRVHAPTFYYVSAAIKQIKELQQEAQVKETPVVVEVKEEVTTKPIAKKAIAKK